MAWFKKKSGEEDSGLPELPELPEIESIMPYDKKDKIQLKPAQSTPSLSNSSSSGFTPSRSIEMKSSSSFENSFKPAQSLPKEQTEMKRSVEIMPKKMPDKIFVKPIPREPARESIRVPVREQTREFSRELPRETSTNPWNVPTSGVKKSVVNGEPIFVRIDKFEFALENIRGIRKKIDEMESLLTNLRQVNAKEDMELSEWEREINAIKEKIYSIDSNLFGKLS